MSEQGEGKDISEMVKLTVELKLKPTLVYCGGCGKDILNIDGCPYCGTTKYLTYERNQ